MSETPAPYAPTAGLKTVMETLVAEATRAAQDEDFEAAATLLEEAGSLAWLIDRRHKGARKDNA